MVAVIMPIRSEHSRKTGTGLCGAENRRRKRLFQENGMSLHSLRIIACACALALLLPACAQKSPVLPDMPSSMKDMGAGSESFSSSTAVKGKFGSRTIYNGKNVTSIEGDLSGDIVMPDGDGGVVTVPGEKRKKPNAAYADARELKLKARELAEQLVMGLDEQCLKGTVALPVSFVNQDNFDQSSSFGRFMAEQLYYEFNQRGFPVREYRIPDNITLREKEGEFYLSRALGEIGVKDHNALVVAGTYYGDKQAVIVNARLIRPSDGRVLRTANLVLQANGLTRRMLANNGATLGTGAMRIRDYRETTSPSALSPIDQGQDIH